MLLWLIVGLIAGALARSVVPGQGSGGWVLDLVIGLVGSVVGGFIFRLFLGHAVHGLIGGTLMAFVGAVALLSVLRAFNR